MFCVSDWPQIRYGFVGSLQSKLAHLSGSGRSGSPPTASVHSRRTARFGP
jgi:hypothetical protein